MTEWLLRIFLGAGAFYLVFKGIYEAIIVIDILKDKWQERQDL